MFNSLTKFTSLLLIVLMGWNLFGWWLFPVSSTIFNGSLSGEACCNGAEICCCVASGAQTCFCQPGEIHENSDSDKPLVCGISSPDNRNHSDDSNAFTFLDIRAFFVQISDLSAFFKKNSTLFSFSSKTTSGYLFELLQPPQVI
jgi:hypothetical protein